MTCLGETLSKGSTLLKKHGCTMGRGNVHIPYFFKWIFFKIWTERLTERIKVSNVGPQVSFLMKDAISCNIKEKWEAKYLITLKIYLEISSLFVNVLESRSWLRRVRYVAENSHLSHKHRPRLGTASATGFFLAWLSIFSFC